MRPESEDELCEAIRGANGPLSVRGGGTRGLESPGEPLETGGLSGITLYEPGALTLVARAGTPLAEVEEVLAREGQRLAFEPMDHRRLTGTGGTPTIGGVVATNASGPRRVQVGACRDALLGVRFVDGRGEVIRSGGRVMKNVTGYDLARLMCGAHGTLGVLTEVSLKVLPAPEAAATLVIRDIGIVDAADAMAAALASPFEVTGAAWLPEAGGRAFLRVEGFAEQVRYRVGRLRDLLSRFGEIEIEDDPARVAGLWADVRDAAPLAGHEGDVWRIVTKASVAPGIAAALPEAKLLFDWGGGLVWAGVPRGLDVRARLDATAHARLVRGQGAGPRFHPEPAPVAALSARLRQQFDPRGILNPGLMA